MSGITTHVLDTAAGRPAAGVPVALEAREQDRWVPLGAGVTGPDGRLAGLHPDPAALRAGVHRLRFDTAAFFALHGLAGFYPEVSVVFEVTDPTDHYHVPLLLAPWGYTTYRGS
jgi:5-hydroxyisourate hydrolase